MTNFNPANADYAEGFTPKNLVVVGKKVSRGNETPIVVYSNEYKGKTYFHVRELWFNDQNETWNVGKGLSLPGDSAAAVFAAIGKLASPVAAPAAKVGKRNIKAA